MISLEPPFILPLIQYYIMKILNDIAWPLNRCLTTVLIVFKPYQHVQVCRDVLCVKVQGWFSQAQSGVKWIGVEGTGVEWSGVEWSGMEWRE